MGLERQVIAACGSAVCGDDLAMEVPVRGPAAAPVEASVVATYSESREPRVSAWSWSPWRVMSWLSGYPSSQAHESPHTHGSSLSSRDDCPASPRAATNNSAGPSRRPLASQQCEGRAHGRQVRASASWRLRGRGLAARGLAAGLLVAVAALLTLPLQAEAQKTTFVSNTGQSTATSLRGIGPTGIGSFFYSQAQRFSTGSNEGGYTLSAIQVQADNFESASSPRVSIYTVTSDNPGTLLYVLTNPATLNDNAINTFRAPANATLEKDTDYFVVFEATGSGSNTRYDLKGTVSANEDSGTASGWSIADTSRERATNSGNWSSVFARLKIAVRGTIPPSISIADASAAENAGHLLFDVTLSRSFQNTVKVDFETISGGTATEGVDYHARRTYTHVILEGDKTAQMGFALIEDTVAAAGETVKVRLSNARVVDAYGNKIKDLDITTAEATGTINAPTTTTTNVPGLTIRIKDATGDEDNGYLDFNVRLSRKHDDYVCYDFETISGGTAEEGTDYLKFPKATYWMQIGKRVDKPFVRIIDDRVNDNGETVKVKISNARLCNDASQTLSITRAEATGTITNSDPIPQAWLARFGRTVAEHVLDGVQARLSAPRNPGMQANVAGLWNLGTTADTTADTPADTALAAPGEAPQDGLRAHSDWIEGGLAGTDPGTSAALNLTARDLITGSAFAATGETAGGGFAAVWGRGAYSSFSGQDSDVTLDGEVTTAMLGADYAAGRWIAGVSLSLSEGEGTYGLDGKEGELDSSLTGFYPYVGYDISERLSAWGVAGYGEGNIKLTQPDTTETIRTGIDLAMVAVGARGDLMPRTEAAGFDLALTSDALMVRTTSAAAAGLVATDADVSRLRLGLDGSWLVALDSGASLTPSISIGMRHDGGDAETGFGVDLGGGLAYADVQSGLGLELNARALLAHEDENFREWGVSGALIFDPDPSSDRGLSLSVGPSWGASSTGGAEALLGPETMSGLALDNATPPGGRLDAEAAWGFPALAGRYTGTPYLGLGLRQGGRDLTLGWRLGAVRREGLELALGLEGRRLESNGRSPEHGAMVRLILRW